MFDKVIKIFAEAIATAVAREFAKQLPEIAEAIAGAVADRVLEKLPDFSGVDDAVRSLPGLADRVVDAVLKRLPKIPFLSP